MISVSIRVIRVIRGLSLLLCVWVSLLLCVWVSLWVLLSWGPKPAAR